MQVTLSQKERMLLEDQKTHEETCITKYTNYANQTNDNQLRAIFTANLQSEKTHLDTINQLLSGNVPQMNQQSNQGNQQNNAQSTSQNSSVGLHNFSDKEMCTDILMTEKYVSGNYNTAIFEFSDTNVRDVLNHIQKEEQKHGEAIFKYMESKGLYKVQ
jgi:spore coat protein CotF